jgi:Subtilase family
MNIRYPAVFPRISVPFVPLCKIVLLLCALCLPAFARADTLVWHKPQDRVDADIRTWDVRELLEHVAATTGWHIYLDPGAIRPVSAKFQALPPDEALRALLGDLNFLILPQTNGPSQLYVFRTSRGQATRLIVPAKKVAKPIPNELVVTLKPGSKTKIEDLAKALGAKIIGRMDAQNTYLLQFADDASTEAARASLADNPDVASVDVNYPVDAPPALDASQSTSPDLKLNPMSNTGPCQLVIGLIDTPVNMQSLPSSYTPFIDTPLSVAGPNQIPDTTLTHGTAMLETLVDGVAATSSSGAPTPGTGGISPVVSGVKSTSVKILPVDVYGNNPTTTTFDVANGIVQAINNGANILNMSLGSTGDSQLLHNTIIQASQQGVTMFAAAGNEPVTTPTYPAAYPEVTAVSASDPSGGLASYANRGSFVKIIAPGDNVVPFDGQNYLVEGTSTSTAIVSGMAAGMADSAHVCADQAAALIQKSASPTSIIKP